MPNTFGNLLRAPKRLARFLAEASELLQSVRKSVKAAADASRDLELVGRAALR